MLSMKRNVQNKIILKGWSSYLNWIESRAAFWKHGLITAFFKNTINFPFPACELERYNNFLLKVSVKHQIAIEIVSA